MNDEAFPTDELFLLRAIVEENITLTRIKYILKIKIIIIHSLRKDSSLCFR